MSGIITGPYFDEYFNSPNSFEIGTMVAILEIGAFSKLNIIFERDSVIERML